MIKRVEHIGIAIADLGDAEKVFDTLFGRSSYKTEEVESEAVKTVFYQLGETKIELLEATEERSAIAKYIQKRGQGIHHIAFEVDDIYAEMERMKGEGFRVLNEQPKEGADNKLIFFLHPKDTQGVLVEFCQEKPV